MPSGSTFAIRSSAATLSTSLAIDLRHARVLDLQREVAAVAGARAVHLSDRRRGDRFVVELGKAALPALAVLAAQHAVQLRRRHRRRGRAQHRERLRELRRQHVLALQRDQLAELHRRAAQVRQPFGEAPRGRRREERAARLRVVRPAQAPQSLDRATDRELAGGESDAGEATEATLGNGGGRRLAGHLCLARGQAGNDANTREQSSWRGSRPTPAHHARALFASRLRRAHGVGAAGSPRSAKRPLIPVAWNLYCSAQRRSGAH